MRTDTQEVALLRILVATGEKALEAFEATENPVDSELVADLRRVIDRSRAELDILVARLREAAS